MCLCFQSQSLHASGSDASVQSAPHLQTPFLQLHVSFEFPDSFEARQNTKPEPQFTGMLKSLPAEALTLECMRNLQGGVVQIHDSQRSGFLRLCGSGGSHEQTGLGLPGGGQVPVLEHQRCGQECAAMRG